MEKHSFALWSPQLRNRRTIDVYLPRSYARDGRRRYPVVYFHDGQNLSNPSLAFGGNTWQLDATLERLAERGTEVIAVGVHHAGDARIAEYSPFRDQRHGEGRGDRYVRFLTRTVMPRVNDRYRTRRDRDGTAVVGSSMGGLISLYAFFQQPSPFGRAGVMSPSIWFGGRRILDLVEQARLARGTLYLDTGTEEGAVALRDARALMRLLRDKGYSLSTRRASDRPEDARPDALLRYVEAEGHRHQERDWARRLPAVLEFLLREVA
jgi:predicted alpha/beta superfamily hydrolase